ncbi:MAG: hypothetical protein QOD81_1522 [Solirubrobacteraceae bacterium]|jgi:hypothetical protein|nr:hypothetical protein [Solirubrobacteraceae bacterium]
MSAHHGRNVGGDHLPGQPGVEDAIQEANEGHPTGDHVDDPDAPETAEEYVEQQQEKHEGKG